MSILVSPQVIVLRRKKNSGRFPLIFNWPVTYDWCSLYYESNNRGLTYLRSYIYIYIYILFKLCPYTLNNTVIRYSSWLGSGLPAAEFQPGYFFLAGEGVGSRIWTQACQFTDWRAVHSATPRTHIYTKYIYIQYTADNAKGRLLDRSTIHTVQYMLNTYGARLLPKGQFTLQLLQIICLLEILGVWYIQYIQYYIYRQRNTTWCNQREIFTGVD